MESVLSQTCDGYEYIIVDGKSTDGNIDIVKKYEQKFNGKLKWIFEKNDGIYDEINKGINIASSDIVIVFGSCNSYLQDAFHILSFIYTDNNFNKVIYRFVNKLENGVIFKKLNTVLTSYDCDGLSSHLGEVFPETQEIRL